MAQIFFSQVGAAVGSTLLPNGIAALGLQVSGAAIGQAVGSYIGGAIDNALFGPELEGPRLDVLQVSESREGVGLPIAFGRVRVPGHIIWASHFTETARDRSVGGKGGPEITEYSYTSSFAVALCEGEITRVSRAWANGGPLTLGQVNHRIYRGTQDQVPDPVIEAVEGAGTVPAYRGTAYIVFEDFDLTPFGNRLPQLSFELLRVPPSGDKPQLSDVVEAVNLIPASGEFVYATDIVRRRWFPGLEQPENMNNASGQADLTVSLDQLEAELPKCRSVSIVVGWFGTGDTAGTCEIRPGVERLEKATVPWNWRAGGVGRGGAHLISRDADDRPVYGGTPDDRSVVQGIRELTSRGMSVSVTPFLFMDTDQLPWRGRLVTSATDQTADVRTEIDQFMGNCSPFDFQFNGDGWSVDYQGPAEWGYRRFILHHAWLAKLAGGVSSFLIGTEMVGLTRLRDSSGAHPFVDALVQLAADVKAVLGSGVEVSYAADWTEYGAYVPEDGSGDVLFPLDPLWASDDLDFIGIDWYAPLGDWRDGSDHLDALAGFAGPDDPAYLASLVEGGEGYDWYYASAADRNGQIRTPIADTAHGEDWVFRVKDIRNWRASFHHERPDGVRNAAPTDWLPNSKPIRFCEVGFPAVHHGANQPNVFFDPKSSESALPFFSGGGRNDGLQRAALTAISDYWSEEDIIDQMAVWAWDARPFPDFPGRLDVWSDGANWSIGHWLNGRAGTVTFGEMIDDLAFLVDVQLGHSGLDTAVPGYLVSTPTTLRRAIEPLVQLFSATAHEDQSGVVLSAPGQIAPRVLNEPDWIAAEDGLSLSISDAMVDKRPDGLRLDFVDGHNDFAPGHVDVTLDHGPAQQIRRITVPIVLDTGTARNLATDWLASMTEATRTASLAVSPLHADLRPGQAIELEGHAERYWIESVEVGDEVTLSLRRGERGTTPDLLSAPPIQGHTAPSTGAPDLSVLDLPGRSKPLVAAFAEPWPGQMAVRAGSSDDSLSVRATLRQPARTGRSLTPLMAGPIGRWDMAAGIEVETGRDWPVSNAREAVLGGAGQIAIETEPGSGSWEVLAYASAEMVGERHFYLSGLLRGLGGSDGRMVDPIQPDARIVAIGPELVEADFNAEEIGLERLWRAGETDLTSTYRSLGTLPWRRVHLNASWQGGDLRLSWIPRGADIPADLDGAEPSRPGVSFSVSLMDGAGQAMGVSSEAPQTVLTSSALGGFEPSMFTVAEIGSDGRSGPEASLSIPPPP